MDLIEALEVTVNFLSNLTDYMKEKAMPFDIPTSFDTPKLPPTKKLGRGKGSISARLRKTKKGFFKYYQGRWTENGKPKTVTAPTFTKCMRKMLDRQKANKEGKLKLCDWLEKWFNVYKASTLSVSVANQTKKYIERISEYFKDACLEDVKTEDIQQYLNSIPQENSNTKRKIFILIKSAFAKAFSTQLLTFNPCLAIDVKFEKYNKKRAYEFKEQYDIMNLLQDKYKAVFYFLCCTGMRISEFLAFNESDINAENLILKIRRAYKREEKTIGKTKTAASLRDIPYIPLLLEKTYELNGSTKFFGTFTYEGIKQAIDRVNKKLGIEGVSVIHSTRHTFSSVCYFVGIKDLWIQKALGHANITMTLDTYTNLLNKGNSDILDYIKALKNHYE